MYIQWDPLLSLYLAVVGFSTVLGHSSSITSFPRNSSFSLSYKSYSHMFAPLQFFSIRASCLNAFFGLCWKCHLLPVSASAFDPKRQFIRSDVIYIHVRWSKTVLCPIASVSQALQATKFCSIRITCFRYSYFTVRITTNDSSVPSFRWKGNDRPYFFFFYLF